MAKDPADNVTGNLFDLTELENILLALGTQAKTLQRKVNTEPNKEIKQIHQNGLNQVNTLIQKIYQLRKD